MTHKVTVKRSLLVTTLFVIAKRHLLLATTNVVIAKRSLLAAIMVVANIQLISMTLPMSLQTNLLSSQMA